MLAKDRFNKNLNARKRSQLYKIKYSRCHILGLRLTTSLRRLASLLTVPTAKDDKGNQKDQGRSSDSGTDNHWQSNAFLLFGFLWWGRFKSSHLYQNIVNVIKGTGSRLQRPNKALTITFFIKCPIYKGRNIIIIGFRSERYSHIELNNQGSFLIGSHGILKLPQCSSQ